MAWTIRPEPGAKRKAGFWSDLASNHAMPVWSQALQTSSRKIPPRSFQRNEDRSHLYTKEKVNHVWAEFVSFV